MLFFFPRPGHDVFFSERAWKTRVVFLPGEGRGEVSDRGGSNGRFIFVLVFRSLNGSMPGTGEIRNNTLSFKGPVTYELAGTYVCDATNSIGTRSGQVEVNVTGRSPGSSSFLLGASGLLSLASGICGGGLQR